MEFTSYDVRWQECEGGPIQVFVAMSPREKLDDLLRRAIGVEDLDKVPFLEVWGNTASGPVHVLRDGGKVPPHSYVIRNKGILAQGSANLLALVNAREARESVRKAPTPLTLVPKEENKVGEVFQFEFVCNVTSTKPKELS